MLPADDSTRQLRLILNEAQPLEILSPAVVTEFGQACCPEALLKSREGMGKIGESMDFV